MKCKLCGREGNKLKEIAELNIKVFDRIPIKDVIELWYKKGFDKEDIICEECIIKWTH